MNERFDLRDLMGFFLGKRNPILRAASSKYLLWTGCLFIVSAGLARNYDHHLLLEEPMWIGGPFVMALFSSSFIFFVARLICRIPLPENGVSFNNYFAWLRCFFLTAPLAWLYGIPYESIIEIFPATVMNFITLIIVSLWRVFLMTRVLEVLFQVKRSLAIFVILLPACLEMGIATFFKQLDIVGIMGGMRLSPSDEFLLLATRIVSTVSWVLFFVSIVVVILLIRNRSLTKKSFEEIIRLRPSKLIWAISISSIAFWLLPTLFFQPALKNKRQLLSLMSKNQPNEAAQFLYGKLEYEFPPGHHIFEYKYGNDVFKLLDLLKYHNELPEWAVSRLVKDIKEITHDQKIDLSVEPDYQEVIKKFTIVNAKN